MTLLKALSYVAIKLDERFSPHLRTVCVKIFRVSASVTTNIYFPPSDIDLI